MIGSRNHFIDLHFLSNYMLHKNKQTNNMYQSIMKLKLNLFSIVIHIDKILFIFKLV